MWRCGGSRLPERTDEQQRQLIKLNDELNRLGFMFEDREPLYQDFLQALKDVRYANRPLLSPDQIEKRRRAMAAIIKQLSAEKGGTA